MAHMMRVISSPSIYTPRERREGREERGERRERREIQRVKHF